jgi:Na+/H+ antiporter NhaD/arsenite permease-like protein
MINKETKKKNTFLDFLKLGLPVAIVALVISNAYLFMRLIIFA